MAAKFNPPAHWPTLAKVVECFLLSGCELFLGLEVPGDHQPYKIRYLLNPENGRTTGLGQLEDCDWVTPDEVHGWERDLEILIPKPWDKKS